MKRPLRPIGLVVCGLVLVVGGCRRGPKPLSVKPASEARQVALGSAVIPNLDRSFERIDTVAKALSFPFDKAAQRKSFLESIKAPQTMVSAVRTDAPVAVVAFAPKQKGKDPEMVVALTGKSPETIKTAIAGLGKPVATQDDASNFKLGEDSVWLVPKGTFLVAASSLDTLILGAALATEVAVAGKEDITVRVSPEAVAKSQGTDVKTAIAGFIAQASTSLKGMPGQNPLVSAVLEGMLKTLGDRVAEVEEALVSLRVDVEKGATLRIVASPRKDSRLAGLLGKPAPFALDGRAVPEGEPMALMAFAPTELSKNLWADLRPLVAKDKAGEEAAKHIDLLIGGWTSGGTGAISVVDKQMRMTGIYAMKKGATGEAYLSAMAGLLGSAWYQSILAAGAVKSKASVKRDKNALVVSSSAEPPKDLPPAMADALKGMGLLSQTYAMVVEGDAMYYASGKDAAESARRLVSAQPRKPTGACAQAVTESAGADAFFFMDFAQLVKLGAGAMGAGENPLFSNLHLPLWMSYRGGKTATIELRIPMELAKGAAVFAPMLMGMGMGQRPSLSP
jgi:hypothetical protein